MSGSVMESDATTNERLGELNTRVVRLDERVAGLDARVARLDGRVEGGFRELRAEMAAGRRTMVQVAAAIWITSLVGFLGVIAAVVDQV